MITKGNCNIGIHKFYPLNVSLSNRAYNLAYCIYCYKVICPKRIVFFPPKKKRNKYERRNYDQK